MRNNSVTNKEKKSDDEEAPKDSESSSDKGWGGLKGKVVAPISGKTHYLNNLSRHKR